MKIDSAYKYPTTAAASLKPIRAQEGSDSLPSESVNLGGVAGLVNSTGGEFNSEKVDRIKAAIAQGSFSVNSAAISDRLLTMAKELLAHGR
ncbi:flagellar biosynthesis anti-sigma factor FlgM [Dechloromonas sp. ZY10]|uniref:flagellar biosynthesis anti-sigma factor FlgM n=1 Tax=Dechloromonas aquae TaxID=2664436 RepID=UPI0035285811